MQSRTKSSRIKLLEAHGVSKNLDLNIHPEKQTIRPLNGSKISQEKPRKGQGRAGMRGRKPLINRTIAQSAEPLKKIPEDQK